MPITLQVECDTPEEYKAYLLIIAGGVGLVPPPVPETSAWQRIPDAELHKRTDAYREERAARDAQLPPFGAKPSATEDVTAAIVQGADATPEAAAAPPAAPATRSRGRPTKAEREAAQEAQKAALTEAEAHSAPGEADPEPSEAHSDGPEADPFSDEAAPEPDPKQAALDLLRRLYELPGMPLKVNELLAKYKVAKFTLIEAARGAELLADARRLEANA